MSFTYSLPGALNALVDSTLADWTANGKVARLWNKDATLL